MFDYKVFSLKNLDNMNLAISDSSDRKSCNFDVVPNQLNSTDLISIILNLVTITNKQTKMRSRLQPLITNK
jgi:hypothetical protein